MNYLHLFFLFLISFCFVNLIACSGDKESNGELSPPSLSQQILDSLGPANQYYEFGEGHNPEAQTILLVAQGGPLSFLEKEPPLNATNQLKGFVPWYALFNVVHVHQAQTLDENSESDGLDARLLSGAEVISEEDAEKAAMKSAAILYKVGQHFRGQDKFVFLLTQSFGSFLAVHALAHYPNIFHKIIISQGRLDMPLDVVTAFNNSCGGFFESDAVTFTPITDCETIATTYNIPLEFFRSEGRLMAALGKNRYTELLKKKNLNNVLYTYGTKDGAVGKLSSEEINFLSEREAEIFSQDIDHVTPKPVWPAKLTAKGLEEDDAARLIRFFQNPLPSSYDMLTMPNEGELKTYLGSDINRDSKYTVAIVFEGHSSQQVSFKMNELFGNGPYSLFKTNVFKEAKDQFLVEYGTVAATSDVNTTSTFSMGDDPNKYEELAHDLFKRYINAIPSIKYANEFGMIFLEFLNNHSLSADDLSIQFYMNILAKKKYDQDVDSGETLDTTEEAHLEMINRNVKKFTDFFDNSHNSSNSFDLKIYVSNGINPSYANIREGIVYLDSKEFSGVGNPLFGITPHFFASEGVHEIGHIVGKVADEYIPYTVRGSAALLTQEDLDPPLTDQSSFRNNCFSGYDLPGADEVDLVLDQFLLRDGPSEMFQMASDFPSLSFEFTGINNPWTHASQVPFYNKIDDTITILTNTSIPNYEGKLYPGCSSGRSFRATENSIMNTYMNIKSKEWVSAWGPINTFYLKKTLDEDKAH